MAYYLGIDGGGTKTRCVLGDESAVLAKAMTGGSNIVRLGEAQAGEALQSGIRQVCEIAKISPRQIRSICIGAAGAARPEIAAKIRSILRELLSNDPAPAIEVAGDAEIALEAAFGAAAGVIVIAGTGSIAYGRDACGQIRRAGGWGFAISDEGSGHWIGRSAVSAITEAIDQDLVTVMTPMVLDAWKIESLDELVQCANSTPGPDFPRLFPIVLRAAEDADPIAIRVLTSAGVKLAALAETVTARLVREIEGHTSPSEILPIAMTGSVFRQSSIVRQVFYNTLVSTLPGVKILREMIDPVDGALARARRNQAYTRA